VGNGQVASTCTSAPIPRHDKYPQVLHIRQIYQSKERGLILFIIPIIRKLSCYSGESSTMMSRWLASWSCLGIAACMFALRCWINCIPPCARYATWLLTSVAGLLSIHPPPSTRYRGGSGSFTSTKQPVQKRWPGWRTAWPSTSGTNSVPRGTSLSAPGSLMDSSHRSFVPKCIHIVVELFEKLPGSVYEADRPVLANVKCHSASSSSGWRHSRWTIDVSHFPWWQVVFVAPLCILLSG